MTKEESIVRARRAARGYGSEQPGKKSLAGVLAVQVLVSIIVFGGVMSMKNIGGVGDSVRHYLSYTVDCKASVEGIIDRCRSILSVKGDA